MIQKHTQQHGLLDHAATLERAAASVGGYAELAARLKVSQQQLEHWIGEELCAVDEVVGSVLTAAGVVAGDVDRVFATGGSSLVPAVRRLLADRFGVGKLVGGDELTSVARGLALRARALFA